MGSLFERLGRISQSRNSNPSRRAETNDTVINNGRTNIDINYKKIKNKLEENGFFKNYIPLIDLVKGLDDNDNVKKEAKRILVQLQRDIDTRIDSDLLLKLNNLLKDYVKKREGAIDQAAILQNREKLRKKLEELKKKQKEAIVKMKKEIDKMIDNIDNFSFPGNIKILGKEAYFKTKEDALKALKKVKLYIGEVDGYSSGFWEGLYNHTFKHLVDLNLFLIKWGVLEQGEDIRNHLLQGNKVFDIENWSDFTFLDLIPAILTLYFVANMDLAIVTAIKESTGRLIKSRIGAYGGIGVMEDYAKRTDIQATDLSDKQAQDFYEVKQREAILIGLEAKIKSIPNGKKKDRLEKNLEKLRRYKLVRGDEFYFKAYLIGKEVGFKNIFHPRYHLIRLMSLANGAKFIYPKGFNIFKKENWETTEKGISFTKILITPELEKEIKRVIRKAEIGLKEYYSGVSIIYENNEIKVEYPDELKFEKRVDLINKYIDSLKLIDNEKKKRKSIVEEYLKNVAKGKVLINVSDLSKELVKFAEKGKLSLNEIKEYIKKDSRLNSYIEGDSKIEDYFYAGLEKPFFFNKEKQRFVDFFSMLIDGKIEVTEENIKDMIRDFKTGSSLKDLANKYNISTSLDISQIQTKGEEFKTKIELARVLFESGGVGEGLKYILEYDERFTEENEDYLKKLLEELKNTINSKSSTITEEEAIKEIKKLYKGYLTKEGFLKELELLEISNTSLKSNDNYKRFKENVGIGNYVIKYENLETLKNELKAGNIPTSSSGIIENISSLNLDAIDINDIKKDGKNLYEQRAEQYYEKEIKLSLNNKEIELKKLWDHLEFVEFKLFEKLSSLDSFSKDQSKYNKLKNEIQRGNKFTMTQLSKRILEIYGLNSGSGPSYIDNSLLKDGKEFRKAIANKIISKVDNLLKEYDSKKLERNRIIENIKDILNIGNNNFNSEIIEALKLAGVEEGIISRYIDKVKNHYENEKNRQEEEKVRQEKLKEIFKGISLLERMYSIIDSGQLLNYDYKQHLLKEYGIVIIDDKSLDMQTINDKLLELNLERLKLKYPKLLKIYTNGYTRLINDTTRRKELRQFMEKVIIGESEVTEFIEKLNENEKQKLKERLKKLKRLDRI